MHNNEKWQVLSVNGEAIAGEWWDAELNNPRVPESDKIVGAVTVFLYRRREDGGLEFLWQRRSEKVSNWAGQYDISAGGHINLGETPVQAAVREAREEIGITVTAEDLQWVEADMVDPNKFIWTYLVDWTGRECDFHFDDDEVSEVKWVPYEEMTEFRKQYAKIPLRKSKVTFRAIDNWLEMHGLVEG